MIANGMTLSTTVRRRMDALLAAQPEAGPWLGVLGTVLEECADSAWDEAAAATTLNRERFPGAPLLAGACIPLDAAHVEVWVRRLLTVASETGAEAAALRVAAREVDSLALLTAAINAENERLRRIAGEHDLDADVLIAVAGLAAMPLLQALRRGIAPVVDPAWSEGVCPICGGWPLLAEQRGLERTRRLRCGRCGGDWSQPGIRCPYCGVIGHAARVALVAEGDREARTIETCRECGGYLKTIAALRSWGGDEVILLDLATVDLDLVALGRGLRRPATQPLMPPACLTT